MLVIYHAVQVDVFKRYAVSTVKTEHNHTANPCIKDVEAGFHNVIWVEFGQGAVFQRISRNERPLATTKPGIKCIFFPDICCTINNNFLFIDTVIKYPVGGIIGVLKGGNWNSPWNLAAEVPVTKLVEVLTENFPTIGRGKGNLATPNGGYGTLCEWPHL